MYFDWITWGIWLTGFFILVVWIWIPVKEIKTLVKKKHEEMMDLQNQARGKK